jgi:hypothetical protein
LKFSRIGKRKMQMVAEKNTEDCRLTIICKALEQFHAVRNPEIWMKTEPYPFYRGVEIHKASFLSNVLRCCGIAVLLFIRPDGILRIGK